MASGVYKITNKITGECYVGSTINFKKRWIRHFRDLKNGNHSSISFQKAYELYGQDAFVCEIIEELPYNKKILLEREQYWINTLDSKNKGYNISDANFGDVISHHPNKEHIVERIKNTLRLKYNDMTLEERKEKWGKPGEKNGMFGRHRTEEEKRHLSECFKGKRAPWASHPMTEEAKKKRREAIERNGGLSGERNPFYGKHHSEDTKKIISEKNKGRISPGRKKVSADGIIFESLRSCAKHFNVSEGTVVFRVKSKHWNWFYVCDDLIKYETAV